MSPAELCAQLRREGRRAVWFQGGPSATCRGWLTTGLVCIDPTPLWEGRCDDERSRDQALALLDREFAGRRLPPSALPASDLANSSRAGSTCSPGVGPTGLAVLMQYGALGLPEGSSEWRDGLREAAGDEDLPSISILRVDRSKLWQAPADASLPPAVADAPGETVDETGGEAVGPVVDSLPRADWIDAVRTIQRRIAAGDLYQANLCRRISIERAGDPVAYFQRLLASTPAPHAALWLDRDWSVASVSPERLFEVDGSGIVRTEPIKGTRPRGSEPAHDAALAAELVASAKDRAELLMIVDLERNDFGRICRPGSVRVRRLAELRSFAAVHHLVAEIEGRLREGWRPSELLRAIYPGGSITGAPKRRAMELLSEIEPVGRGFFTGSLLWFGDDGRVDASLLIRTGVFDRQQRLHIGAGCGIVADSEPLAEWRESNHKAGPLMRAVGPAPGAAESERVS